MRKYYIYSAIFSQHSSEKVDKTNIAQTVGGSTTAVMSQKAVTDELAKLVQIKPEFAESEEWLNTSGDTSKMYVLPDGFIYVHRYSESAGPSYTNLSEMVLENTRMGSSGTVSTLSGAITTDFIPIKKGQTLRFKGLDFANMESKTGKYPYICFYTAANESAVVSSGKWDRLDWLNNHGFLQNVDGVWTYTAFVSDENNTTPPHEHPLSSSITHVRLCGMKIEGEDVIVTVNQEITENSGGGYAWQNTGLQFIASATPEKLPNPFPITINGVSYDGSKAVDISITASSGGSNQENNTNLFSFENADVNFSYIASGSDDKIYDTSSDYGYKDTANLRFVSKKSTNTRVAVTGGLPKLPAGEYIVTAEVYMPSEGSPTLAVGFGGCTTSNHKQYNDYITLSAYDKWITVTERFTVTEEDTAVYIAMMCTGTHHETYWRNVKVVSADAYENTENGDYSGNILYGKKWVACGDSFTAGGYNTSDGFDESVHKYQDGRFAGQEIVYPFIIGLRNNMNIVNLATGGQTMATTSANNSFMTRYTQIDADADYITIKLGINDKLQEVQMGALNSTDTSTFCGAFNTAMEHILENHPFAHIGIMVSNGTNEEIM